MNHKHILTKYSSHQENTYCYLGDYKNTILGQKLMEQRALQGALSNTHQYDNNSIDTLTYHYVVKVIKGNFIGYYVIVVETGDLKGFAEDDEKC